MDRRPYLTENSRRLVESRYLLKNNEGKVVETPRQMFERVAKCVTYAERTPEAREYWYNRVLEHLLNLNVMPASPYLFNSRDPSVDTPGGLFSCFVLPLADSIDGIYDTMGNCARVYQAGGGIGIDISVLREKGSIVKTSKGKSSGPLSFLEVFDASSNVVTQGGVRRAASIAFMDMDHPDIEEFITVKSQNLQEINRLMRIVLSSTDKTLKKFAEMEMEKLQRLTKFNLSVKLTDRFMKAVEENSDWNLVSRQNGKVVKTVKARRLFNMVCEYAWKSGDPGVCFIDTVNEGNTMPHLGRIEASNPCGELYMHPYHACNLVAVNLNKCFKGGEFLHSLLEDMVRTAVRIAENAIDVSSYPLKQIEECVKKTRGVGIGLMGFADILIDLGIPYDSEEARDLLRHIGESVKEYAIMESIELAKERGLPENWKGSVWEKKGIKIRNLWHTTLQPTGSVAMVAGASHSIEPYFNVFYRRRTYDGDIYIELNPKFKACIEAAGLDINAIIKKLEKVGSIQKIEEIPADIRRLFKCAADISVEDHIKMQAAAQENVDSGISKTINMPPDATVHHVAGAYKLAHRLKCKGTTIFREGSKAGVLSVGSKDDKYHEELRDFLFQKYCREGLTAKEIADLLGVSEQKVFAKLKRYGIRKEEHETARQASMQKLTRSLTEIIMANILVGHSKLTTVDHQSSYRQVADHLVYAHDVRKQFLDHGIVCGPIESIVTDKTYYYFDTHFLKDLYDTPIDYDSVIDISTKRELREFVTPYFVRHLYLVGGIQTKHGGIKFKSNSRNIGVLKKFMEVFSEKTEIEVKITDERVYIPKSAVEDFYTFIEDDTTIEATASKKKLICPECGSELAITEKCKTCPSCGWGACSV